MHPETIDAMDYLYAHDDQVLGLCTFCYYHMIEYGVRSPAVMVGGQIGGKPAHSALLPPRSGAEWLVGVGFRCWLAGYDTGDIACWENGWNEYNRLLGTERMGSGTLIDPNGLILTVNYVVLGAREVSFTVLSMSLSLIAVFIPILLMGGIIGRYFREFAVTLSVAVLISLGTDSLVIPAVLSPAIRGGDPCRR